MSKKIVLKDRTEYRNSNGELDRKDGPAVEYNDGTKVYFLNGMQHRIGGPAVEYANGTKEWYVNGRIHREDGPAIEFASGTTFYYLNGKLLSKEVFNELSDDDKKQYNKSTNESKLYTSINEFKRTLIKENNTNTSNIQIIVKGDAEYRKIKDSYIDGETDEVDYGALHINGIYNNLDELITVLNSAIGFEILKENMIIMDDRIIIDTLVDEDDNAIELDTEEYDQWKNDEIEGFNYQIDITIQLNKIESITDSQEISKILGIQNHG